MEKGRERGDLGLQRGGAGGMVRTFYIQNGGMNHVYIV